MVAPALPLSVLDIPDVPDVFTGPRRFCTVLDCSAASQKGLDVTGWFWGVLMDLVVLFYPLRQACAGWPVL